MSTVREIGSFEVLERLGAGGMGVVYRARDRRLNRFVAIKVLPEAASAGARERFQREALAIAALNHPNICTLYEAGEHDGQPYLVMELLEGETLHARLARGAVPMAQLVAWSTEVADALQAAHGKGILHRDLKPGNIFITRRGTAKVLDFGLAQFAASGASDADAATMAGTLHGMAGAAPLTSPGTALGTAAYMSPEQARGESVDARSDVFSLGVVLYEMAGGRAPFQGRTSADLSAAILMHTPPPPSSLRPEIPARLDDIIAQCLEKDPELRFQSSAELRVSLKRLSGAPPSSGHTAAAGVAAPPGSGPITPPPSRAPSAPRRRRRWAWTAPVAVVLAITAWYWAHTRKAAAIPVARDLSFRQLTYNGQVQDAAISPDGKFLAHVDGGPQGTSLHLLSVANASDVQIMPPAPGCCSSPSFSPDGSTVYFVEDRALMTIPVLGGTVRTVADNVCSGAGVSADGKQIAYLAVNPGSDQLMVADADGGHARVLRDARPDGFDSRCWIAGPLYPDTPAWSPDGGWIAVQQSGGGAQRGDHVMLVNAVSGAAHSLGPDLDLATSDMAWLPDGSGLLLALAKPQTAASQLWELSNPAGMLVQLTHDLQGFDRVTLASQAGGAVALVHSNPEYSVWRQARPGAAFEQLPGGGANQDGKLGVAWTPQGQVLSVRFIAGQSQLWLEGGGGPAQQIPVSNLPATVHDPLVTRGGQFVFAGIDPGGAWSVYRMQPSGGNLTDLTPGLQMIDPALVDSGRQVAGLNLYETNHQSHQRLWTVPLAGGPPREVSATELYTNFILAMPDQKHVLALTTQGSEGTVIELGLASPDIVVKPRGYRGRFAAPHAITPDGNALVSVVTDGNIGNLWGSPLDGGPAYPITHFADSLLARFAYAPDGRLAVSRGVENSDVVVATGLTLGHP